MVLVASGPIDFTAGLPGALQLCLQPNFPQSPLGQGENIGDRKRNIVDDAACA